MDWIQVLSILATVVGGFLILYRDVKGFEMAIRADMNAQSLRSDRLYEMFIELVKERK